MPYVPNAWTPPTPGPVYFNPGLKGAIVRGNQNRIARDRNAIARDRNTIARERTGVMESENALDRQAAEAAAGTKAKKDQLLQQAQIIAANNFQTKEEAETFIGGELHEVFSKGFPVDPKATKRIAEGISGQKSIERMTEEAEATRAPGTTWEKPYQDEFGNRLQKSSTGQIRKISSPSKGMEITSGDTTIRTNVPFGTETTKPVQTELQKDVITAEDSIIRLKNSLSGFQKQYQTFPFRGQMKWEELKQKGLGSPPTPEVSEMLTAFSTWHKTANEAYAIAVQNLGKGNLTKNEEKLYGGGLPNPGTGVWPKDPPDVYIASATKKIEALSALVARRNYYMNPQGMGMNEKQYQKLVATGKVESVKDTLALIDKEGEKLEAEYVKAGITGTTELMQMVMEDLTELFGDIF